MTARNPDRASSTEKQWRQLGRAATIELAIRKSQPLATCDRDLIAAATRCGLEVLAA